MNSTRFLKYIIFVLIVAVITAVGYRGNQVKELEGKISALNTHIEAQNDELMELSLQLEILQSNYSSENQSEDLWFWSVLDYPVTPEDLIGSLVGQESLIPFEGVLGGSLYFVTSEAKILDQTYVYIPIEDGHQLGAMVLKYKFVNDKQVEWQVVDGWWPKSE